MMAGARAITHVFLMKILEEESQVPEKSIRHIFSEINTIATKTCNVYNSTLKKNTR